MSALDAVIAELQRLLQSAKEMESRCLGEILALERMVNRTQKCIYQIPNKESLKEQTKKQEPPPLSVQDKVDAIMSDIQARQRIIQIEKTQPRPKFQTKLPEIAVVEKKPPIPTANRNERAARNMPPAYVPPRNRNEVTGKVTQTTMRTSGQKVFRPEKTSAKKVDPKEMVKTGMRERTSVEKSHERKEVKPEPIKRNDSKKEVEVVQQANSREAKQQRQPIATIEQKKEVEKPPQTKKAFNKIKFATFHKEIEEILSQIFKQGPKNHKPQLQKLISDYQTEQKGHRMHQDSNRRVFLKKLSNYALSRHAVYPMSSYQLPRNKWNYHPDLPDFHLLLDSLENQLANLQLQKDCRIDKKSQFRIVQSHLIYEQTLEAIKNDYEESKENVPEMLDLTFTFNEQQRQTEGNGDAEWQRLSEVGLNNNLLELLEDISSRGTLQKAELRGLQVLSEVGIFKSKRSPVIVMEKEYSSWKEHYSHIQA